MDMIYSKRCIGGNKYFSQGSFTALQLASIIERQTDLILRCRRIDKVPHGIFYIYFAKGLVLRLEHVDSVGAVASIQKLPDDDVRLLFERAWMAVGTPYQQTYKVVPTFAEESQHTISKLGLREKAASVISRIFKLHT